MKKIILAAAVLLMSTGAFAQTQWGVKGGLNFASLTKDSDLKFKPSFHIGGYVEFEINEYFSIQPELLYSRQGAFAKNSGDKYWMRMNYINLPIIAKLYVYEGLSVELGPQIGYMINAKMKEKENGKITTYKIKDSYKDFDFSFVLGAGYKITEHFDVYARYTIGFTKVFDKNIEVNHPADNDIVLGHKKSKNSVIQLGVGYRF